MKEIRYNIVSPAGMPVLQCWIRQIIRGQAVSSMQSYASLRIVRIRKGRAAWQIGAEVYPVLPGDMFLFNNQEPRRIVEIAPEEPLCMETVAFLPLAVHPNRAVQAAFFGHGRKRRFPAEAAAAFYAAFDEIWSEAAAAAPFQAEMSRAALLRLTVLFARACGADPAEKEQPEDDNGILQAVMYIHRHLQEPIREETLARRAGMSISAFSRAFRRCNGITMAAYLRRCRVQMALERIQTENCNVLEAALQSGFQSSAGFYKAVREITGQTPRRT